jgi:hypothetical protein
MLILYYIYDVICFITVYVSQFFCPHDVLEFDMSYSMFKYLILNNLLIYM